MEPYTTSNIIVSLFPFISYIIYNIYSIITNNNDTFPIVMIAFTLLGFIMAFLYIILRMNIGYKFVIFTLISSIILYGIIFATLYGRSVDLCKKKKKSYSKIAINSGISSIIILILLFLFFMIFQDLLNSPILQLLFPSTDINNFRIRNLQMTNFSEMLPHIIANGANMTFILYIAIAYSYYRNYCE
jgi:hypothetical protein